MKVRSSKYHKKKKVFCHLDPRFKSKLVEKTQTRICITQILWIFWFWKACNEFWSHSLDRFSILKLREGKLQRQTWKPFLNEKLWFSTTSGQ